MPQLDGSNTPVELALGLSLTAPGLLGSAQLRQPVLTKSGRGAVPRTVSSDFGQALATAGFRQAHGIAITNALAGPQVATTETAPAAESQSTAPQADPVLQVPHPGAQTAAVLMISDDSGVVTWHFAQAPQGAAEITAGSLQFVIPRHRLTAPEHRPEAASTASPASTAAHARMVGPESVDVTAIGRSLGTTLLSVLEFPVGERAAGWVAEEVAKAWERNARPYGVRLFTLPEARTPSDGALNDASWRLMSQGRALLFLHGIFSTSEDGFSGLPDEVFTTLAQTYGNRLFTFEHPTVSVDPIANIREFLTLIPAGVELDIDIVTHSRGGLLARIISGELPDVPVEHINVGKIIFVGTPNVGTPLLDGDNIGAFLDRFTTLLNLIPPGPWSTYSSVVEGVLEVVKIVGVGAVGGLPGMESMKPGSDLLNALNIGPAPVAAHYAVDANFEPTGALISLLRAGDLVIDEIFKHAANDVAVPSAGVGNVPGDVGFPVPDDQHLQFGPGPVWHSTYFSQPETAAKLTAWLTG